MYAHTHPLLLLQSIHAHLFLLIWIMQQWPINDFCDLECSICAICQYHWNQPAENSRCASSNKRLSFRVRLLLYGCLISILLIHDFQHGLFFTILEAMILSVLHNFQHRICFTMLYILFWKNWLFFLCAYMITILCHNAWKACWFWKQLLDQISFNTRIHYQCLTNG